MDHIAQQEESHEQACYEAAKKAGITQEQADNCDNGEHQCQTCPWQKAKELTYEDLKDILEMSGVFDKFTSFTQIERMKNIGRKPTMGNLFACERRFVASEIDALIKTYCEYTSGKLASTYELVDGLKDMLSGGRLTGSDIPDDFDWLHQQIDKIERNRA